MEKTYIWVGYPFLFPLGLLYVYSTGLTFCNDAFKLYVFDVCGHSRCCMRSSTAGYNFYEHSTGV